MQQKNNLFESLDFEHEYSDLIRINNIGKVEILDKNLLANIKNDKNSNKNLLDMDLKKDYINFSCNGNSSCS